VKNITSENCTNEANTMDNRTYLVTWLLSSLLTYLFSPWSGVLLEMLTVSQLVKKFPAIYGTPNVHYSIYNCSPPVPLLSQINPIHAPITLPRISILISSSHSGQSSKHKSRLWQHKILRVL
jgi:hypothetical protein